MYIDSRYKVRKQLDILKTNNIYNVDDGIDPARKPLLSTDSVFIYTYEMSLVNLTLTEALELEA